MFSTGMEGVGISNSVLCALALLQRMDYGIRVNDNRHSPSE